MKIHLFNLHNKVLVNKKILKNICKYFINDIDINLIIFNNKQIEKLNFELFKIKKPTDVISINSPFPKILGDIYVSFETILENSKKFHCSFEEEFARVVIHGILHLKGYDHKNYFETTSKEKMFLIQENLVKIILKKNNEDNN